MQRYHATSGLSSCLFRSFHRSCHSFIAACFRRCCSQADHGPFLTMVIVGAFRLHAETGRWSVLLKMTTPPGPRNYMRNEALLPNHLRIVPTPANQTVPKTV